jgi:hypothetical protein
VAYFSGGAVFHGKSCLPVTKKSPISQKLFKKK